MRPMPRRLLGLILAAAALCAAAGPARADQPVSSHAMVHTCCTPPAMKERIFAEAAASGAEFIRVDIELNGIFEGAGSRERPHWSALDEIIALAERHDLRVLGLILGMPTSLSTCPELGAEARLCPARDPPEFGRLAAEVAAHARGSIEHWEIWNEPDAGWAFNGTPEEYARMLSSAYDEIHARVPAAQVLLGGVERPHEHAWTERMLATPGANAARKFDIAALHLRVRLRNELADLPAHLRSYRDLLAAHGFQGALWVTEHGYPADPQFQWDPDYGGGDAGQAAFLRDSIPALTAAGADQVFVTLRDNLWGEYLTEGLVHIDESVPTYPAARRPAFETVREQSAELDLAMLVELLQSWWL
jgi:hypothetical protein